ncbi:MAG TPA: GDSL-type esterase/lipase family protein, partial [Isosphaeraceae bacterium]
VGLSPRAGTVWVRAIRNILVGLGGALVVVSATPLSPGSYLVLLVVSLLWLAGEAFRRRVPGRLVLGLRAAAVMAWLMAVLVEAPYHVVPRVPPLGRPVLGIIGDSVTSGLGEPRTGTWPGLLARRHGVPIRDHSEAGATARSASGQAEALSADEQLVLLEIGGNDLLGGARPEEFAAGLETLLTAVSRPGRVVVMLELPLPPFSNEFGRVQRRLARRHRVLLVPKRVFLGVLQQEGATFDSIHLTPEGHDRMAAEVWEVVRGAYREPDSRVR